MRREALLMTVLALLLWGPGQTPSVGWAVQPAAVLLGSAETGQSSPSSNEAPQELHRVQGGHGFPFGEPGMRMVPSIQALAAVGERTIYAGSFGLGVFRSDDRGLSWKAVNKGLGDSFILSLATTTDGALYAGTVRGGVFRTMDGGQTWHVLNDGFKGLEVKSLLVTPEVVYAGTANGVFRLVKGETRWTVVTKGLDQTLVPSLAIAADGTLFAGTSGKGIMRFKDVGTEWKRTQQGLKDHEGLIENFIRVLTVGKDQAVYAGTFDGGVFRSNDGGDSWQPISRALPNDSIRGILAIEKGLFVATGRGVFKTVTQGRQWIPINQGLTQLSVQAMISDHQGALYVGTSAGVFRSDDEGATWVDINKGLEIQAP